MNLTAWGCALLALAPASALLCGYPRRFWASAALSLGVAAGSLALVLTAGPENFIKTSLASAWSLIGCAYVLAACRRALTSNRDHELRLEEARRKRGEVSLSLEGVKAKGLEARREQQETQALYGVIKGLAETLTWEEIRPKLELAVSQYLASPDFALYVAGMTPEAPLSLLTVKNLEGQLGGSWVTLARLLEDRGLPMNSPHILESPEKAVALPILDGSELLGYFYARVPAGVDSGAFSAKASTFVYETAFAFKRVRLYQEVDRLSRIDGLTGVYRRGAFDERIEEESVRAKTFKTSYGLMLLDIDHFKKLNDHYGHPFGDQVLRRVGEILNSFVYETDFIARYGGEEFVVLLSRAEPAGALRKAEAIRKAIEAEHFPIALETVRITVSIGIAHFPRDSSGPKELVAAADSAMYQAKSLGRNRVVDHEEARRQR